MTVKEEAEIPVYDGVQEETPALEPNAAVATAVAIDVVPVQATVDVVAPTNMAGGYEFNVDSSGKMLRVAVPPGGVVAGQRFSAIILDDMGAGTEGNPHKIPTGRWRDDLCDCCKFGCCHAMCCLSFWCTACSLGQVMTRNKLSGCGDPLNGNAPGMTAFRFLFIATTLYIVITRVLDIVIASLDDDDDPYNTAEGEDNIVYLAVIQDAIQIAFFIFIVVLGVRTRSYIRGKYNIPEGCCGGCEDCCCSFWCLPCTVCQMSRHTADFEQYSPACCSDTGLTPGAPEIV